VALEAHVLVLLVLAAFAAGAVDAIAGGGGLMTVPALLAAGLPPHIALATNKGQACFGAISSFASLCSSDGIDRRRAPLGFAFGLIGSLAGARVLLLVRPEPLKPVVLVLLLVAAGPVAWPRPRFGPIRWAGKMFDMTGLAPERIGAYSAADLGDRTTPTAARPVCDGPRRVPAFPFDVEIPSTKRRIGRAP
jgi:uncharacterized membrane protein YfcA